MTVSKLFYKLFGKTMRNNFQAGIDWALCELVNKSNNGINQIYWEHPNDETYKYIIDFTAKPYKRTK